MAVLVVEPRRRRDAARHPVDHDVGEQLVLRIGLLDVAGVITPAVVLLDDPGRKASRRVMQSVAQRLRPRALDLVVAEAVRLAVGRPAQRDGAAQHALAADDVQAGQARGVLARHPARHRRAPVRAVHAVARIAQPRHQGGPEVGHAAGVEAGPARLVREAVAGHCRNDDVEGIRRGAAVRNGINQRFDHLRVLVDRTGPAVEQQQRQRIRVRRALVDEVDVEAVDVRRELVETVQPRFLRPPVEAVAPVLDQLPQIGQAGAVVPVGILQLVRKADRVEPRLQVVEHGVRHVDGEGRDGRAAGRLGRSRRSRDRAGDGRQEGRGLHGALDGHARVYPAYLTSLLLRPPIHSLWRAVLPRAAST